MRRVRAKATPSESLALSTFQPVSISLFSHDCNPAVDPRLCRVSNARCREQLAAGELFMLDERRAQLFKRKNAPKKHVLNEAAVVSGRNSCRKIGKEAGHIFFQIHHFSYPVPACVTHFHEVSAKLTNSPVPIKVPA
jgi:hypothetical protein